MYDDTVEKFWAFLSTTAQRYVRREDYEMVTFVPVSQRELPAHAVVLDHNKKEIMILIRCGRREELDNDTCNPAANGVCYV